MRCGTAQKTNYESLDSLENIAPRVWWAAIVIIIEGPGLPSALLPISNAAALEKVYLEFD